MSKESIWFKSKTNFNVLGEDEKYIYYVAKDEAGCDENLRIAKDDVRNAMGVLLMV